MFFFSFFCVIFILRGQHWEPQPAQTQVAFVIDDKMLQSMDRSVGAGACGNAVTCKMQDSSELISNHLKSYADQHFAETAARKKRENWRRHRQFGPSSLGTYS